MLHKLSYNTENCLFYDTVRNIVYKSPIDTSEKSLASKQFTLPSYSNTRESLQVDNSIDSITIILSNQCNMNCRYCDIQYDSELESNLDIEQLRSFVISLRDAEKLSPNIIRVQFYGGEPLLQLNTIKSVIDLFLSIQINTVFSLTTNGILLNSDAVEYLKNMNVDLAISIDGPEEIHDRNRSDKFGNSTYKIIESNLDMIRDLHQSWFDSNVSINSVLTPGSSIIALHDFFLSNGIRRVNFLPLVSSTYRLVDVGKAEYKSYVAKQLALLCQYNEEKLADGDFSKILSIPYVSLFDKIRNKDTICSLGYCGAGTRRIAIDPAGFILPCLQFANVSSNPQRFAIGTLTAGINNSIVKRQYQKYKEDASKCSDCWMFFNCSRLCPYFLRDGFNCKNDAGFGFDYHNDLFTMYIQSYVRISENNPTALQEYAEYVHQRKPTRYRTAVPERKQYEIIR